MENLIYKTIKAEVTKCLTCSTNHLAPGDVRLLTEQSQRINCLGFKESPIVFNTDYGFLIFVPSDLQKDDESKPVSIAIMEMCQDEMREKLGVNTARLLKFAGQHGFTMLRFDQDAFQLADAQDGNLVFPVFANKYNEELENDNEEVNKETRQ